MRAVTPLTVVVLFCRAAAGQGGEAQPKFEAAQVHTSPKSWNANLRNAAPRGGRYDIKNATMVDLIRAAYNVPPERVLAGPSWLELDRYDVAAKLGTGVTPDDRRLMLQALLAERFGLELHKDTKPLPAYALTAPQRKAAMKEADGEGEAGCNLVNQGGGAEGGGITLNTSGPNGTQTFRLGPGAMIQMACRNMTMAAFTRAMRTMFGSPNLGANDVLEETGLKGAWTFSFHYSLDLIGMPGGGEAEHVSFMDALDKQLGLKLEKRPVPTPVLVVDKVNRQPSPDPPGTAEAMPPVPQPTEFDVADVKPADPQVRMNRFQIQPGGRITAQGMTLRFLINRAFNVNNRDQIVGLPGFADNDRFDINAKAPSEGPNAPAMDNESVNPMLRALLVERFGLKYHTEKRQVSSYSLAAAKPKMKKADPNSRTWCKRLTEPGSAPAGMTAWACQNVTMEIFAERLNTMGNGITWPVKDATGLEGGWDFTFTFSPFAGVQFMGGRGGGDPSNPLPAASEPTGMITLIEAVEKQLGLKLETQKREEEVIVIDHIEQKPTDN
jgi:uncharacterized protein (TIGR03435 family)